jgi:hypothetical protein
MKDPYDVFDGVVLIFERSGIASRLVEECGGTLLCLRGAGTSVPAPLVGSFSSGPAAAGPEVHLHSCARSASASPGTSSAVSRGGRGPQ